MATVSCDDDDTTTKPAGNNGNTVDFRFDILDHDWTVTMLSYDPNMNNTHMDDVANNIDHGATVIMKAGQVIASQTEEGVYTDGDIIFSYEGVTELMTLSHIYYKVATQALTLYPEVNGSPNEFWDSHVDLTQDNEKIYLTFEGSDEESHSLDLFVIKAYLLKSSLGAK